MPVPVYVPNMKAIRAEIDAGFIGVQKHPVDDLFIYNYTPRAQYENHWTPETLACRGLIIDGDGRVRARPFPKFFNHDQVGDLLPREPFEVFDKLDGSLGILYRTGGCFGISTRGSFVSEQAKRATRLLTNKYRNARLSDGVTLLFEIIYPENRIVCDYGDREELVLLAAVETKSGCELPYCELFQFGFPVVERFDGIARFDDILRMGAANKEGFVVRFQGGLRVKVKLEEYKRLHRLLTGLCPRHVWEWLRDGRTMDDLLDGTPDEFHGWLRGIEADLRGRFAAIESRCRMQFRSDFPTRKEAAEYIKGCDHPAIIFSMLDGKDYAGAIWKLIRPEGGRAFRCDDDA